jgi:hypothetical protein
MRVITSHLPIVLTATPGARRTLMRDAGPMRCRRSL